MTNTNIVHAGRPDSRIDVLESRVTELEEDIRQANQTNDRILTLMRHHGLLGEPDER